MTIAFSFQKKAHVILLIFLSTENGPFLLVEATVCYRF